MKKSRVLAGLLACALSGVVQAEMPAGWFAAGSEPNDYDMGSEPGTRRPGGRHAFIRARPESKGFGTMMQAIDAANYRGQRLRLSGYLRTKDAGKAQMWMRVDGSQQRVLAFDNMETRALKGDNDWKSYAIVLDVPEEAVDVAFGFLLSNQGTIWADDFRLETVGKDVPVTEMSTVPKFGREPVNLDFSK